MIGSPRFVDETNWLYNSRFIRVVEQVNYASLPGRAVSEFRGCQLSTRCRCRGRNSYWFQVFFRKCSGLLDLRVSDNSIPTRWIHDQHWTWEKINPFTIRFLFCLHIRSLFQLKLDSKMIEKFHLEMMMWVAERRRRFVVFFWLWLLWNNEAEQNIFISGLPVFVTSTHIKTIP